MTTTTTSITAVRVSDLSCDAITVQPIDIDWSAHEGPRIDSFGKEAEELAWTSYEASVCSACDAILILGPGQGDERHQDLIGCDPSYTGEGSSDSCEGHVPLAEGPMMNYAYPLPDAPKDAHEAAIAIAHLPVCLVEFTGGTLNGTWALALTGGGMDLSWEICEAYMLLGYLPPLHYADLPGMCGRGTSERDRKIAQGCLRSCQVSARWAQQKARSLRHTLKCAAEREAAKKAG